MSEEWMKAAVWGLVTLAMLIVLWSSWRADQALKSRLDAAERNVKHWQGLAVANRNVADDTLAELAALKAQQEPVAWRVTGAGGLTVTPEYPKWAEDDSRLLIESLYTAPQPAPAQDVAGWIPVTERLPEVETDVLVRGVRRNEVMHRVAGLFNGEWSSQETEDLLLGEVTHWMPLPAAPAAQHNRIVAALSAQQSKPSTVTRETIRAVFLRNGFTIKEGQTDLKPYVYAAAEELLSIARASWQSTQSAGVPDGERLAELLESVRLGDDEAKPHGSGATYWNNAVLACQVAIRDALAAAPTLKAEQVQASETNDQIAKLMLLHGTPEQQEEAAQYAGLPAPSLPAAGSAAEEVEVVGYLDAHDCLWNETTHPDRMIPLMTVGQHQRIVAALSAQQSAPSQHSSVQEIKDFRGEK